jgi:hypothetical protein
MIRTLVVVGVLAWHVIIATVFVDISREPVFYYEEPITFKDSRPVYRLYIEAIDEELNSDSHAWVWQLFYSLEQCERTGAELIEFHQYRFDVFYGKLVGLSYFCS